MFGLSSIFSEDPADIPLPIIAKVPQIGWKLCILALKSEALRIQELENLQKGSFHQEQIQDTYSDSESEDIELHSTPATDAAYEEGVLNELYESRTDSLDELVFYAVTLNKLKDKWPDLAKILVQECNVKMMNRMELLLGNIEKLKSAEEQCYDALERGEILE